ncbi:MAG: DUF4270 family protein [Paludibacteraceae bacterium]|nr:DUF4270 family protein [Paludibacteraceae bacterium]
MSKRLGWIVCVLTACLMTACKDDAANAGSTVLDEGDKIIVLSDTFDIRSTIGSSAAIISQTDSFLLGEIETDYGLVRASVLTQLACPEGYSYPDGAVMDSVCLLMAYTSWVGDGYSPLALDVYEMDRGTFAYSKTYLTDLNIQDYCSRSQCVLEHQPIVVASEKRDSVQASSGNYVPMLRIRLNDNFANRFASIRSFDTQEAFNQQFHGLMLETSFGSSTVLNVTDIALGVYYHFTYSKAGRDTTVYDMKAFYANSEVRTINHVTYEDKNEWIETLQQDSDYYNYVVAPAGVYTRLSFPMDKMVDSIYDKLVVDTLEDGTVYYKRPYVNLAEVRVDITNVFSGSSSDLTRNDWLQPASYMLLIREESAERFFANKELPSDTCALLSSINNGTDSLGNTIYYYSYDLSDFLTNQLRQDTLNATLNMLLVPVTVSTATSSSSSAVAISSVKQQQTLSATQIVSARNGMKFKIVYSGF